MVKIVRQSNSGKTKELMEMCIKNAGTYVCKNPDKAIEKCRAYGYPVRDFNVVSYGEVEAGMTNLYIDEVDCFLTSIGVCAYSNTEDA